MIVKIEHGRARVDREALALITGRSRHTIRFRLSVDSYTSDGRALYVLDEAMEVLAGVPARRRAPLLD